MRNDASEPTPPSILDPAPAAHEADCSWMLFMAASTWGLRPLSSINLLKPTHCEPASSAMAGIVSINLADCCIIGGTTNQIIEPSKAMTNMNASAVPPSRLLFGRICTRRDTGPFSASAKNNAAPSTISASLAEYIISPASPNPITTNQNLTKVLVSISILTFMALLYQMTAWPARL